MTDKEPPEDLGAPVSYLVLANGTPVFDRSGDRVGTVEHVLAEGDLVAGRVTWCGTQDGSFAGVAPTGRRVLFEAYHLVRFVGGKAAEWWGTADISGALAQLSATPAPVMLQGRPSPTPER
jgi:hypothetical protein